MTAKIVGQSLEQLSHGVGYPARFGGEEFVIVLPGKALEAAEDICDQIRDYIASRSVRAKSSNKEVGRILALPDVKERLQSYDFHVTPVAPEELDKQLRVDVANFRKIAIAAGLITK